MTRTNDLRLCYYTGACPYTKEVKAANGWVDTYCGKTTRELKTTCQWREVKHIGRSEAAINKAEGR